MRKSRAAVAPPTKEGPPAERTPEPVGDFGASLSERDFVRIRDMLYQHAGIELGPEKHALVANRLQKRLRVLHLDTFEQYANVILAPSNADERQTAIDLLTTNETFFFREPTHFEFLKQTVVAGDRPGRIWRIWSAACSSGEEPYSIAMTLTDAVGPDRWELIGSDISRRVLARAARGHYQLERVDNIPPEYLRRFCLRGIGPEQGTLLVERKLREKIALRSINLMERLPELGSFDFVFLRNVLIYFNREDRQKILARVSATVKPGGHLVVSHSESLFGLIENVKLVRPSVYLKVA